MKLPFLFASVLAILFTLAIAVPAYAFVSWNSGWSNCCINTWGTGIGSTIAFSSAIQPVNFHNQFVTFSRVTPVATFSSVSWVRSTHPMHFGFFNPVFVAW